MGTMKFNSELDKKINEGMKEIDDVLVGLYTVRRPKVLIKQQVLAERRRIEAEVKRRNQSGPFPNPNSRSACLYAWLHAWVWV